MKVTVNGQQRDVIVGTVADLVGTLGLPSERVALERNFEIVPRTAWAETSVTEGDRFEIVHFVGGG